MAKTTLKVVPSVGPTKLSESELQSIDGNLECWREQSLLPIALSASLEEALELSHLRISKLRHH